MTERWCWLGGWEPDLARPGFLKDQSRPGWARTPDGRWWSQTDIDRAAVVVDEAGTVVRLELEVAQGRLATTPADEAANDRALADPALVKLFRERRYA